MAADSISTLDEPGRTVNLFDLLSDETRLRIVDELYHMDQPAIRFSELARRVEAGDPGRFNYHLKRLQEQLVIKTDGGYRLSDDGERIAQAVFATVSSR